MYNDYMYAVDRSDEYLAHYGIKGMKWGIRKARESGNSRKLERAYRKASRRLAKLERQASNGKKYARRAAAMGAGAAVAGSAAALGTERIAGGISAIGPHARKIREGLGGAMKSVGAGINQFGINAAGSQNKRMQNIGTHAQNIGSGLHTAGQNLESTGKGAEERIGKVGTAVSTWGKGTNLSSGIAKAADTVNEKAFALSNSINPSNLESAGKRYFNRAEQIGKIRGVSNDTIARIGAGVAAAGLGAGAAYNAYRATHTKKAAQKAAEWRREMDKELAGTKYSAGGPKKRKRR